MDLKALKHLAGVVQAITLGRRIIVFGSSSLFASFPHADDDYELLRRSMDADFVLDPFDEATGKTVGDAIGAEAEFANQHGYYADIVRPIVCENFPPGWEDRLIPLDGVPNVFCLEPHDMAVAKLFAGRPKDISLLTDLLKSQRLHALRIYRLPMPEAMIVKTHQRLRQAAGAAGVELPT
jgi:hypothetical protein